MRPEKGWLLVILGVGLVTGLPAQSDPMDPPAVPPPQPGVLWKPGTLIQSQYKELAGTLVLEGDRPPMVRTEGHDYLLMLATPPGDLPLFKNKAAVILKGIAGVVTLAGQPPQYRYWPMEFTIKLKRYEFPDPSADHWKWLVALGRGGPEPVPNPKQ